MPPMVLYANNSSHVSSSQFFEVEIGNPTLTLYIASGIAVPEIEIDDDDDISREEVIVKLGVNVSAIHEAVTQVGLASISNDESAFVFATDAGKLIVDPTTTELELHVQTAIMGDDSSLSRFSYQIVVQITKVNSRISGAIIVPRSLIDLKQHSATELDSMFRVRANRIETIAPPPGSTFIAEKLIPVATGKSDGVSCEHTHCFVKYVIDGCPLNIPLRVTVELSDSLGRRSAGQVAGPNPVLLTSLVPAVAGVNFGVFVDPVA